MTIINLQNIKKYAPYSLKQVFKYIYSTTPLPLRYGKVFRNTYKFLQESQWWSKERLENYQLKQLEKLLNHAYANVPYYRKIFEERGLKPKDIRNTDDLKKLPYLTKDLIRENLANLVAQNYSKSKLHYVTTGGSTGTPMGFYWEAETTDPKERAFVWRGWNWAGYRFGQKRVTLRGNVINRFKNGNRQWWEYNPLDNALILSSYGITEENLPKYIEKIYRFKPLAIQGYPSSLFIMANFLKKENIKLKGIKCILTSSETLYQYQRELIEKYFGTEIFDHYGNSERNTLIMQCTKGNYHIIPEYGITELIEEDGSSVSREGKAGEIIATGFNNYAMPFIRYRTGDIAVHSNQRCSCGRNYPLLGRIEGRVQDFFVSACGDLIPLTGGTDGLILEVSENIKKAQFYQEKDGYVILKIGKKDAYSDEDSIKIYEALNQRYGNDINFRIEFVNDIPRTQSGKFSFLIQKLPIEFGEKK